MHNYPHNNNFLYHNLKLHKMIDMHSKYDNMHSKGIFNALVCINNHVNSCINFMLSSSSAKKISYLGWRISIKKLRRYDFPLIRFFA